MFTPRPGWFEYLPAQPALSRLGQSQLLEEARELDEGLRRSLGWTLFSRTAMRMAQSRSSIERPSRPTNTQPSASSMAWSISSSRLSPLGVILYAESEENPNSRPGQLGEVAVAGLTFPIVLRRGTYEHHIGPLRACRVDLRRTGPRVGAVRARVGSLPAT